MYKEGENFAGAHDREALILELVHKEEKCKNIGENIKRIPTSLPTNLYSICHRRFSQFFSKFLTHSFLSNICER